MEALKRTQEQLTPVSRWAASSSLSDSVPSSVRKTWLYAVLSASRGRDEPACLKDSVTLFPD